MFPESTCGDLPGRRFSEHSVTRAGRSVGGGRHRWLAPTCFWSQRRECCRCLWLLWLVPLWLLEAVRSDALRWRSLALLGWARTSPFVRRPAAVALVGGVGAVVVGAAAQRVLQKVFAGQPVEALRTESSGVRLPARAPPAAPLFPLCAAPPAHQRGRTSRTSATPSPAS